MWPRTFAPPASPSPIRRSSSRYPCASPSRTPGVATTCRCSSAVWLRDLPRELRASTGATRPPSVEDGDALDLHQEVRFGEPLYDDERVGWIGRRRQHLVTRGGDERAKTPMGDVGRRLHQVAEASAVMGEDRREILVALPSLGPGVPDTN